MASAQCTLSYGQDPGDYGLSSEDEALFVDCGPADFPTPPCYGYVNEECVGEVDPASFEITRPCR